MAVATSAVIPGSRSVDQPPSAPCRDRRKATALSVIASTDGTGAGVSAPAPAATASRPAPARTPRACTLRPRNRRRVVVMGITRDPFVGDRTLSSLTESPPHYRRLSRGFRPEIAGG